MPSCDVWNGALSPRLVARNQDGGPGSRWPAGRRVAPVLLERLRKCTVAQVMTRVPGAFKSLPQANIFFIYCRFRVTYEK